MSVEAWFTTRVQQHDLQVVMYVSFLTTGLLSICTESQSDIRYWALKLFITKRCLWWQSLPRDRRLCPIPPDLSKADRKIRSFHVGGLEVALLFRLSSQDHSDSTSLFFFTHYCCNGFLLLHSATFYRHCLGTLRAKTPGASPQTRRSHGQRNY